jgi:1-deoxy-D-xylulose-5-phosphate reductoisomerase
MDKTITLLGSTGSIGTQTLDVVRMHHLHVHALAANRNVTLLEQQVREFHPEKVCVFDAEQYPVLRDALADCSVKVVTGMEGLCELAGDGKADLVVNAVVGMVGLQPTLAAIAAGTDVALANKETLVAGGALVMAAAAKKGVSILPVDSEHSAIFQCLQGNEQNPVKEILLTASGGPFFGRTREQLATVTAADALKHPNWDMGSKVTIDSATMMNKGLECIEAKWLFHLQPEQITVVVHRQSIIHSAVVYDDNAVIAQLGVPDMRLPIQYAILYPERKPCPAAPLSLTQYGTLTFAEPDEATFRCLALAKQAMKTGELMPCIMNGANEVAVRAFLDGKIGFLEIADCVEAAMRTVPNHTLQTCEDVLRADQNAREVAQMQIAQLQ